MWYTGEALNPQAIVARERDALAIHRASLRGGELPSPKAAPRGTFVHGLLLPVSLLAATLRSRELRGPFLRVTAVRVAILVVVAGLALRNGAFQGSERRAGITVSRDKDSAQDPVNLDVPGLHVHLDNGQQSDQVTILGQPVAVNRTEGPAAAPPAPTPSPPASLLARTREALARGWARLAAFVAGLSIAEGIIVFFSRRWDDWLSFYVSGLAGIRPEAPEPPRRRLSFDLKWLARKVKRRIRGYLVFGSAMPLLYLLRLIPVAGTWLFGAAVTLWAWYLVGIFTASKSAHAWADDGVAGSPVLVQSFNTRVSRGWWLWPLRVYGRMWAWVVRSVNAAAATFDRNPAPFLGLALARAILALPGLYLLARPIVPVAAGRLCAESDPGDRFSIR